MRERAEITINSTGRLLEVLGTVEDISEHKRAEEEINQAKNLLRTVIDATPDWIFVKDRQHRFVLVNQAFANSQGLEPAVMLGRPDTDFWPENRCYGNPTENIRGFHTEDDEVFAGKRIHNPVDQVTLADGRLRWFDIIKLPLRNDADFHTIYVSPQLESQLGYSVKEWLDNPQLWIEQIHPDDRERIMSGLSISLMTGAPYHSEYRIYKKDGSIAWVRDDAVWLKDTDGKPKLLQGVMFDITYQRQAEEELGSALEELQVSEKHQRELRTLAEREQSRMGALLSAMSIGILFEDNERRVEYVNPAFLRMWGINEHENLLHTPTKAVLERAVERFAQPMLASKQVLNVLDTHEISERFELELNDGRILTQSSYPVNDIKCRIIGRLWIYEDITQQRQTAQQPNSPTASLSG